MTFTKRTVVLAAALMFAAPLAAQTRTTEMLAPSEQKAFVPGYPVGNIVLGSPRVADFKVLSKDRRELLLFGRAEGQTTLTLWDQRGVKRHEITIVVRAKADPALDRELRVLLQDFPSVTVQTLGGLPVLSGAVSSKDDLAAVEKIAAAAKVRSLVRYVPPAVTPAAGLGAGSGPVPTPSAPAPVSPPPVSRAGSGAVTTPADANPKPSAPPATGPARPAEPPAAVPASATTPVTPPAGPATIGPHVEYEIELLEASSRFRSGSYGTGIEPSGKPLYRGKLQAPIGAEGEIFIGGKAVTGKDPKKPSSPSTAVEQGIRLTLRPQAPDGRGRFVTAVLVQTNLPIGTDTYDPDTWRKARWSFTTIAGEPFGITGADLLASPDTGRSGGSAIGSAAKGAGRIARLPGVPRTRGTEMVPVFGTLFGSSAYKQNQTQLLVIIRPRFVPGSGS